MCFCIVWKIKDVKLISINKHLIKESIRKTCEARFNSMSFTEFLVLYNAIQYMLQHLCTKIAGKSSKSMFQPANYQKYSRKLSISRSHVHVGPGRGKEYSTFVIEYQPHNGSQRCTRFPLMDSRKSSKSKQSSNII